MNPRPLLARVANAGLAVSGLALVVVLGTGGTRIELPFGSVGLRHVAPPVTFLCLCAALRLLAGSRASGLEARAVAFFARQGMPPRDAGATAASAARAGALLGAGLGIAIAAADAVRVLLVTPPPPPPPGELIAFLATTLGTGVVVGGAGGALAGALVYGVARLLGAVPGRYEAGRRSAALLLAGAPLVVWLAPPAGDADRDPATLLIVAASLLPLSAAVFLLFPAAVLRAQRGRWGVAVVVAVGLALGLASAAIVALAPPGLYVAAHDAGYPNVLLVSVTGLRTDVIGPYSREGTLTPQLTLFASRGAGFREVLTPSTETAAAAASTLTGLYPASHGLRAAGGRLRPGLEGLPLALGSHGYRTAAFVSTRRLGARETGLAPMFQRYDDPTSLADWLRRTALGSRVFRRAARPARPARDTVAAFRDWLEALPRGPWFAWLQLGDLQRTHPEPAPPDLNEFGGLRLPEAVRLLEEPPPWSSPEEARQPIRDWVFGYARAVRATDGQVQGLIRAVAERGELHRTLIVVVSEGGTPLGEDGHWFDAPRALEEELLLVPWIVVGPGVQAGTWVGGPCSLVDLAPTMLGLAGVSAGRPGEGEDLSRYLLAPGLAQRDPRSGPVFSELIGPGGVLVARSVRFGRFKVLRDAAGNESLYVVEDDGTDRELPAPRGREERQQQQMSDMLTRRAGQELE